MAKLIPLKVTADTSQADGAIDRLNKKISTTGKKKFAVGFSDKQFKQYERLVKKSDQISAISAKKRLNTHMTLNKKVIALHKTNQKVHENAEKAKTRITEVQAKARANISKEAAKRVTNNKKTQDKIQEASEKSKLKVSEISARRSADAAKEANKRITDSKRTEARIFEAKEKSKIRDAENAAKARRQIARDESLFARRQKQKEVDHFLKLEREKDRERNRRIQRVPQGIQDGGRSVTRTGVAVTAAVTVPIVAATDAILTMGSEYEVAMNVFQVNTQATAAEMRAASKEAIKLGNDLTLPGVSAKDAGDAMAELGRNGFTAKESIEGAQGVLKLSIATNIGVTESAEAMSMAIQSFGLRATDAVKITDIFAEATRNSSLKVVDLQESLKNSGSVMKAQNQSILDTVTALTLLAKAGIKGGDAGTGLKVMMLALAAPSSKAADAMNDLGIKAFDAQGNMKKLPVLLTEINQATSNLTKEEKIGKLNQIFGKIGIKTALPLLAKAGEEFDNMSKAIDRTGGATELASARTKGLAGAYDAMISQLETFGLIIFDKIKEPLKNTLIVIAKFIGMLSDGFSALPGPMQAIIVVITGIVAALGPVLIIVGTLITGAGLLLSALLPLFGAIGSFISLVGAAGLGATLSAMATVIGGALVSAITAALPVIAAVAGVLAVVGIAIAAAVAYVVFLYEAYQTNFAGIRDFVDETYATISELITSAITEVYNFVSGQLDQIKAFWKANGDDILKATSEVYKAIEQVVKVYITAVKAFWTKVGPTIIAIVKIIWNNIKVVISNAINIVLNVIRLITAVINGDWSKAWNAAKQIAKSAASILQSIVVGMVKVILKAIQLAVQAVIKFAVEFFKAGLKLAKNLIDGLLNGLSNLASKVYNKVKGVASSVLNTFTSVFETQSPSKATFRIGQFVSEGLGLGLESKINFVKTSAKKVAKALKDELSKAADEITKLTGLSGTQVTQKIAIQELQQMKSKLESILKLRGELGVNTNKTLPNSGGGIQKELDYLNGLKNVMKEISDQIIKDEKDRIAHAKLLADTKKKIVESGTNEVSKLKEETLMLRATTELGRLKISQQFALIKLRKTLNESGDFSPEEIQKLIALQIEANSAILSARKSLDKRTQVNAGESLADDLLRQLDALKQVNVEQTVYQETLARINAEMPNISKGQKEHLLGIAGQIDALNKLNAQYEVFQSRIRQGLDALLNNDLKGFFSSILDEFKNLLSDMLTEMITSKLFKLFTGQSAPGGGGGGIGGLFTNLLGGVKKLFGLGGAASSAASSSAAAAGSIASSAGGAATASGMAAASSGVGGAAGIGGTAAGGAGGLLGSLGGLFTNPWTAVAAGAAIGGFFLFKKLFGGGTHKKLKKAAKNTFGVDVKDKSILKQLKVIGESYFGKGQAGKKAVDTVQTFEGKQLLKNYAENTGQSTSKFNDFSEFKDADFSGNQLATAEFDGFRANGGPAFAGKAIVVGDGGEPELFIPRTNGTIVPASQLGGENSSVSAELMMQAVEMFIAKVSSMPAGEVLRTAIDEDPDSLSNGINETLSKNPETIENMKRNLFEGRD